MAIDAFIRHRTSSSQVLAVLAVSNPYGPLGAFLRSVQPLDLATLDSVFNLLGYLSQNHAQSLLASRTLTVLLDWLRALGGNEVDDARLPQILPRVLGILDSLLFASPAGSIPEASVTDILLDLVQTRIDKVSNLKASPVLSAATILSHQSRSLATALRSLLRLLQISGDVVSRLVDSQLPNLLKTTLQGRHSPKAIVQGSRIDVSPMSNGQRSICWQD